MKEERSIFRDYEPAQFADAYGEIGQDFERFLVERDNLVRGETATELKRPVAEALARPLLARFGDRVLPLRRRQLFGHMIRHVMEKRGFVLDQDEVRIPSGILFTRAARYRQG